MLDALVSAGLSDVIAVATRYFGGVLLGAGGLTRAYRAAVAEAVAQAGRVRRAERIPALVTVDYALAPQIEAEARRRGYEVGEAGYGEAVEVRLVKLNSNSLLSVMASVGQASTHRSQWMQRR